MRWAKVCENLWVSEREVNNERSRILEFDGVFHAYGENQGKVVHQTFDSLRDAKKWVRDNTGWGLGE